MQKWIKTDKNKIFHKNLASKTVCKYKKCDKIDKNV